MPELPEVESLRRSLEPHLLDRVLSGVEIYFPKLRWTIPQSALHELAHAKPRLAGMGRRGKYLIFQFSNGLGVLSHLGMSGQWLVDEPFESGRHMHVVLRFGERTLTYRDHRRFGMIDVVELANLHEHPRLLTLGPEPLGEHFNADLLWPNFHRAKVPVKTWLMNAKNVVGVGNIYASEALYLAGIRPTIRASRVQKYRFTALVEVVRKVIGNAIDSGGTTLQDYRNADGEVGGFQERLQVYGRDNAPCYRCGAPIVRVVIAQRSTFYCGACQRA